MTSDVRYDETVAQARKALSTERLVFGDERQIRLLRLDALASELESTDKHEFADCDECDGDGTIDDCECPDCHGHKCTECKGSGKRGPGSLAAISAMTREQVESALASRENA